METNDIDMELLGDSPALGDSEVSEPSEPSEEPGESLKPAELDEPEKDEPAIEEPPVSEPESVATPAIEFEGVELTPREKALLARLEEVTGKVPAAPETPASEPTPTTAVTVPNFLEGLDLDEVLSTPENLNAALGRVYVQGMQEASKLAAEQIMRNLPQVISTYVTQHITLRETVDQFYKEHPQLKAVRRTVSQVANEIAADEPELSLEKVFAKSAERVYKMLNLTKQAPKEVKKPSNPGFVNHRGNGSRAVKTPELAGLAKEITDLLED